MSAAEQIKQARKRLKSEALTIKGADAILDLFYAVASNVNAGDSFQFRVLGEAYPAVEKLGEYCAIWYDLQEDGDAFLFLVRSAADEVLNSAKMLDKRAGGITLP